MSAKVYISSIFYLTTETRNIGTYLENILAEFYLLFDVTGILNCLTFVTFLHSKRSLSDV